MKKSGPERTLTVLLVCIFFFSVTKTVYTETFKVYIAALLYSVSATAELLCHWVITETYLRASSEAKVILTKKADADTPKKFNRKLIIVRYFVIVLLLAFFFATVISQV